MGLFDQLQRATRTAGRTASRAAKQRSAPSSNVGVNVPSRQARGGRRSGGGTAEDPAWSNLLLESVKKTIQPNGDVLHQVKPMEDPREDGVEWNDLLLTGGESKDVAPDAVAPAKKNASLTDWRGPAGRQQSETKRQKADSSGRRTAARRADPAAAKAADKAEAEGHRAAGRAKRAQLLGRDPLGEMLDVDILGVNLGSAVGKPPPPDATLKSINKKFDIEPLSWKEYNALTPRQRTTIDWNTMLTEAVQSDLSRQDEYKSSVTNTEREKYDKAVEAMLGEGRGSNLYAPATVAILQRLNLNPQLEKNRTADESVADLDDYLNLDLAITADEIDTALAPGTEANAGRSSILNSESLGRTELVNKVADRAQRMADAMAKSQTLLQTFAATGIQEVGPQIQSFGGSPLTTDISVGYGTGDLDSQFREYFSFLSNANIDDDPDEILGFVQKTHGKKGLEDFLSFADTFSRQYAENGLDFEWPSETGEKVPQRSAREVRQRLGLDR